MFKFKFQSKDKLQLVILLDLYLTLEAFLNPLGGCFSVAL